MIAYATATSREALASATMGRRASIESAAIIVGRHVVRPPHAAAQVGARAISHQKKSPTVRLAPSLFLRVELGRAVG